VDEGPESRDAAVVAATMMSEEGPNAEAESSLPPPVSQEVFPPPPDPEALPEAEKRQLDIRLAQQRFNYFEDDVLIWSGPVSSGRKEHPTPKGSYHVQSKMRHKRSGSYTNYFDQPTPMPYALQFRGPYWVHEGYVTGKPESHGCVRLRHADAKFVFARIKAGDRIVVGD
jgi:lipoprotein-anchoring transpeptidase ErfK/SrfK